jgi:hypothetical protein
VENLWTGRQIGGRREIEDDPDDGPLLWQAIALVQWKYGQVDDDVLERVRRDIEEERGLDLWRDDQRELTKRRAALEKFFRQVSAPNPKPSSPPKLIVRRAPFEAGDCLAVRTEDGRYTAAIVLKVNNENPECGMNLVGGLDYLADEPPTSAFFEERRWLFKHHGKWNGEPDLDWFLPVGFRKASNRISVVGKTEIGRSDPRDARGHAGWNLLGHQILLCKAAKS